MWKNSSLSLLCALVLSMSGCFNSFDVKQPGADDNASGSQGSVLSGVAVDDLILDGIVTVYPVHDRTAVLATGRTSTTDGSYTVQVSHVGVVVVEVTCDGRSQLFNPVTQDTKACQDVTLHAAAAVSQQTERIKVPVTPATEIMTQRLEALGGTPANLRQAKEEVKTLFGVDPLAADPTGGAYAKVIDAFHKAAEGANKSVAEVVEEVADDLKDGEAGDDTGTTALVAQAMREQNLTGALAESNGTVTFDPDRLAFSADELNGKTFYIVEAYDFGKVDFNTTQLRYTNMLNPADIDVSDYSIEDGKIVVEDEVTLERLVKAENFWRVKMLPENTIAYIFNTLDDAKEKVLEKSVTMESWVEDPADDSLSAQPGFELTELKTAVKDNNLIVVVHAKGDINTTIAAMTQQDDKPYQLTIEIDDKLLFIVQKEGFWLFNDQEEQIADAGMRALPAGIVARIPLDALGEDRDLHGIRVETGIAGDEEHEDILFDRIETFVSVDTLPVTADMIVGKTFYNITFNEKGQKEFTKYIVGENNISVVSWDPEMETEQVVYEIENGQIVATEGTGEDSKTYVLKLLQKSDAGLTFLVEDVAEDKSSTEVWLYTPPAGFPAS